MDNAVLILNKQEHAEMVKNLSSTREFLDSTVELLKEREIALQAEYEALMQALEMTEESLLKVNNVLFEITVP